MGGIASVLNIAKDALSVSQYSLSTTGHNISNVSTPGYSRQVSNYRPNAPVGIAGLQIGMGVNIQSVMRSADSLLEQRLIDNKSLLASFEESQFYMNNLESVFSSDQENSINSLMGEFWNTWQDVSNNPANASERMVVREFGNQMAEQFGNMNEDLEQLKENLTSQIETGVLTANELAQQIAEVNAEIRAIEVGKPANDQQDTRIRLISELSELIPVKVIEQPDNTVTLVTENGYPMVVGHDAYSLSADNGVVNWVGTQGSKADITADISSGKLGGWLVMRDETIEKYMTDLDSVAKEMIWQVNKLHSQGTGLSFNSSTVTGTYKQGEMGLFSTLDFGSKIDYTKDFKVWVSDNGDPPDQKAVEMDMGLSTSDISNWGGVSLGNPSAKYRFTVTTSGTVGAGTDNPVIAWEELDSNGTVLNNGTSTVTDVNTFSSTFDGITFDISAGYLVAGNTFEINTDAANAPDFLDVSANIGKTANSVLDTYVFKVESGGGDLAAISIASPMVVSWSNSYTNGTLTFDDPKKMSSLDIDGMSISFNSGTVQDDDVFTITTDSNGAPIDENGIFSIENPSDWKWTMESFKNEFNAQATAPGVNLNVVADINIGGYFQLKPENGYSFAFSDDQAEDAGVMAAFGINTFFTGDDAFSMGVNSELADINKVAAARINGGDLASITSDNLVSLPINILGGVNDTILFEEQDATGSTNLVTITLDVFNYTTENDLHSLAADIEAKMNAGSLLPGPDPYKVTYDETNDVFHFKDNDASELKSINMLWSDPASTAFSDLGFDNTEDKSFIPSSGVFGVSENSIALDISDIRNMKTETPIWYMERGQAAYSTNVTTTLEGYYQEVVSDLGVRAASIKRGSEFNGALVESLTQQRESISGVSIDEEMINMIEFQQSFAAAAKLISTADAMLQTLLALK